MLDSAHLCLFESVQGLELVQVANYTVHVAYQALQGVSFVRVFTHGWLGAAAVNCELTSCLRRWPEWAVQAQRWLISHLVVSRMQAIRLMRPGVEQWVIVSDFHGFGFGDLSPRMATAFLEVSAKHYPERLCAFLVRTTPITFRSSLDLDKTPEHVETTLD